MTVPFPVPLEPPVSVIQALLETASQEQVPPVLTVTLPVEAALVDRWGGPILDRAPVLGDAAAVKGA